MIKNTSICAFYFLVTLFATFSIAQQHEFAGLKQYSDKTLGGECFLKSLTLNIDDQTSMRTFEIEVPEDGEYYLTAWLRNTEIIKKNKGLKFFIDNQKFKAGMFNPKKEGWHKIF